MKAVIDMGTNTFQLLIAEEGARIKIHQNIQTPVQLGLGAMQDYFLKEDALNRAKEALLYYESLIKTYDNNSQTIALGTSILRNAKNREPFFEWIRENTLIKPLLISGDQEANYIFQGIIHSLPTDFHRMGLVIDIGGGSTEFILFKEKELLFRQSFEIGGLKLLSIFNFEEDYDPSQFQELKNYIKKTLEPLFSFAKNFSSIALIGSAGAFETFYDLECGQKGIEKDWNQHAYLLDQAIYDNNARFIKNSSLFERENMKGMKKFRSKIIPFSVAIVEVVKENLPIEQILVSNFSMKEGYFFSGDFEN